MRFSDWAHDPRKTKRWQRFRKYMLGKYLTCERCGTRVANEVHHLESIRVRRDLAYSEDHCRALCHQCHVDAHNGPVSYRPRREGPPHV